MGVKLSHAKKRMAIITPKNYKNPELIISRNTKDGQTVSINVNGRWLIFNVEDILIGLTYVTNTDKELREVLDDED